MNNLQLNQANLRAEKGFRESVGKSLKSNKFKLKRGKLHILYKDNKDKTPLRDKTESRCARALYNAD